MVLKTDGKAVFTWMGKWVGRLVLDTFGLRVGSTIGVISVHLFRYCMGVRYSLLSGMVFNTWSMCTSIYLSWYYRIRYASQFLSFSNIIVSYKMFKKSI